MGKTIDILITGGTGQIGVALQEADWPAGVSLHTPARRDLNLADGASIRRALESQRFDAVINAGAWTEVDKAEAHVEDAFLANAMAPAIIAEITREAGIPLVQVSTDYVFDGKGRMPYVEDDAVAPLGVYGASKLAGELAVRSGNPRSVVLRTAWVVSAHGTNFLKTMLRLAATRPLLRVVGDQQGCPTSARDIADALKTITMRLILDPDAPTGVYHFVNGGETTWAGLAQKIFACSREAGGVYAEVQGIPTADYPTPAARPANSRLAVQKLADSYGIQPRPWGEAISEIVSELIDQGTDE